MAEPIILVVDDCESDRLAHRRALVGAAGVVMTADSLTAALPMVVEHKPDVVVLDYNLPDGNGLEFMQRLKELALEVAPSIVMVTGSGDEEIAVAAIKAGASDYLIKDVQGGHLKLLPAVVNRVWREMQDKLEKIESERQLRLAATVYMSVSEGLMTTNRERQIVSVNPAICAMTGYTAEELIGNTPRIFKSGLQSTDTYADMWRTLQRVGRWQGEIWNRRKDGSVFLARETITAIRDDETEEVQNYVGVLVDVTDARCAEEELVMHRNHLEALVRQRTTELLETEQRASLILQSTANGLYGIDTKGVITFMNPFGCAMLGYSVEDVVGKSSHALFHYNKVDGSPYPSCECPAYATLRHGGAVRVDNEVYWHADGHAVPVMYATHPIVQNDEIQGAVISFVDMSEQRAAAQARERALLAAENLARVRREFLANMSHEIRTPLNGVLGFAQIGQMTCHNADKARHAFEMIQTSGNQLLRVVSDVLDFSKIEAGKLQIELVRVNLPDVVDHAVGMVTAQAQAKHLKLHVALNPDLPRYCLSDPARMEQILINLLSNAVKFTEDGSITVNVSIQNAHLIFSVADTGIGMSEAQIVSIFNPFFQVDNSSTRRFGGTGLGLSITKGLLDLMQGDIQVSSQLGMGSTFEVRIPYVPVSADEACETVGGGLDHESAPLTGVSVLVAEDSEINKQVLEALLLSAGARVTVVGNGQEAVECVIRDGRQSYDVVLMDLQMPVMDGYSATSRLLSLVPDLPIIGQTAHAFAEDRLKCLSVGMVDHLSKPIDRDLLVHAIKKALDMK